MLDPLDVLGNLGNGAVDIISLYIQVKVQISHHNLCTIVIITISIVSKANLLYKNCIIQIQDKRETLIRRHYNNVMCDLRSWHSFPWPASVCVCVCVYYHLWHVITIVQLFQSQVRKSCATCEQ